MVERNIKLVTEQQALIAVRKRESTCKGLTVRSLHNTLKVVIQQIYTITQALVATFQIYRMTMADASTQRLCKPVSVNTTCYRLHNIIKILFLRPVVAKSTECLVYIVLLTSVTKIISCQIWNSNIQVAFVSHFKLSRIRLTGLNYNNTISSFRAIDSLGSSVFQEHDCLYTVHIKVIYGSKVSLKSVKNEERLIGIASIGTVYISKRLLTTHLDFRHFIWVGT